MGDVMCRHCGTTITHDEGAARALEDSWRDGEGWIECSQDENGHRPSYAAASLTGVVERLFSGAGDDEPLLLPPKVVCESEYTVMYELLRDVADSATYDLADDEVPELIDRLVGALTSAAEGALVLRHRITDGLATAS